MGKMVLMLLVGMGAIIATSTITINTSALSSYNRAIIEYERNHLQNLCDSGLEFALSKLAQKADWSGVKGLSMQGGTISIVIEDTKSQYPGGPPTNIQNAKLVTTTAKFGNLTLKNYAVIQLKAGGNNNSPVPPFMKYALATGGNINLNGNVKIVDDSNDKWNADVHTNGNFSMNGVNTIKGFLTYKGNASSNPKSRLNTNITPNQNPNSLPNHNKTAEVTLPTFDASLYASKATQVINGNHTASGNIVMGSKDKPAIILVKGDLNLSGKVTGYGTFIVTGNVNVTGSVTVEGIDPNGNNLAIYTNGNINGAGNITLSGQIYANGNVSLGGNTKVYGSITSKGNTNFNGTVDIYYRPATSQITSPFWNPDGSANTGAGGNVGGGNNNELLRPIIISTINE